MTYLLCSVHHIDVNPISTSPLGFSHLFSPNAQSRLRESRAQVHGTFVHIQVRSSWLPSLRPFCVMRDRLSDCSAVNVCLGSGRLKDALNRFIEQGVILGIGLLGRQPLYERPRKARYDAVIPAQAVVAFFP